MSEAGYKYDSNYPFLSYITNRSKDPLRSFYDATIFYRDIFIPLGLRRGDKVLDVGSCVGRMDRFFRPVGINTYGIDINFSALVKGVELNHSNNGIVADALFLPFKNASFDYVVSYDFLEHVPSDRLSQVLDEMERVSRNKVMFHRITTIEDKNIDSDESHVTKWSEETWKEWFANHGWKADPSITKKSPILSKVMYGNFLIIKS